MYMYCNFHDFAFEKKMQKNPLWHWAAGLDSLLVCVHGRHGAYHFCWSCKAQCSHPCSWDVVLQKWLLWLLWLCKTPSCCAVSLQDPSQKRVRLSGYGVELAIKSTEYKAKDDTKVEGQWLELMLLPFFSCWLLFVGFCSCRHWHCGIVVLDTGALNSD